MLSYTLIPLLTGWSKKITPVITYWFYFSDETIGWYLFQLIFLLKPYLNYSSSFTLFWVDKVTTETLSFVSVIANVASFALSDNTHF